MNSDSIPIKTVDDYLDRLSENELIALETLRRQIIEAAPEAEECISYQVPVFKLNGSLVGFGAAKKHLSFYVMNPTLLATLKAELTGWKTMASGIQFTAEKPLPVELVQKIVRARVAENRAKMESKKKPKK